MLIDLMNYISIKFQIINDTAYTKQDWVAKESAFQVIWIISIVGIQKCGEIIGDNSDFMVK